MNGSLHLDFERTPAGSTVLHLRRQEPPWRVIRAFTGAAGEALVHLHNVSGGVLSGDQLELRATVGRGARAQVTTTGATRVYRSKAEATSASHFELREGSLLDLLPDAIIPYAGSVFTQTTTVELEEGATLFWWEMLAPGREARGEIFQFERLRLETEIRCAGVPVAIDRAAMEPRLRPPAATARMGECRHLATFYVCRAGEPAATWRAMEECLEAVAGRLTEAADGVRWGISPLVRDGLVARGMSPCGAALAGGLREIRQAARLLLTGEPATPPRKVY